MGELAETTFMKPAVGTLRVYDDAGALARGAAEFVCDIATRKPGQVRIALAGGETPKAAYRLLAADPLVHEMPWDRVHWLFGDERFVPASDAASNYGMARAAFLSRVPAPAANIHPVPTEGLDPDAAATAYEATLKRLYGSDALRIDRPLLDVALLGLGSDGHTASLLPATPVLAEHARWVAPVPHGRSEARITLTYPALNSSRVLAFLVSGEGKRDILDRLLSGDTSLPAGRLQPVGDIIWFADRAAAGRWC
jgi:6-phosphogluconolactonase